MLERKGGATYGALEMLGLLMVLQRLVVAELVLAVVAVAARQPLLKRRHMLARLK